MTKEIEQVQLLAKSKKPAYLRECELATRWAASMKLLQKMRLDGRGPPYAKIGGMVRYPIDQLLIYEERALHRSTSQLTGDQLQS